MNDADQAMIEAAFRLLQLDKELAALRSRCSRYEEALRLALDPPLVLTGDDPHAVVRWMTERVSAALTPSEKDQ